MTAKKYTSKLVLKGVAVLVLAVSLLGVAAPSASADIKDATMDERVKSFSYYSVFNTECTLHKDIKGVDNYDWFNSGWGNKNEVSTPVGTLGCRQGGTDWIKDATRLWGFPSDAGDTLCDLGYRQQRASSDSDKSKCGGNAPVTNETAFTIDRNGANNIRAEVLPKIRDKYYGGGTPQWNEAMSYYAAVQQLLDTNVCGASTTERPNTTAFKMFVVNADKDVEEIDYYIDETKTTRVQGALYPNGSEQFSTGSASTPMMRTCAQLATHLNNDAPANAYQMYLDDHPNESPIGVAATTDVEAPGTSSCRIEFIGWIICPAVRFLAQATDVAYVAIESMLTVRVTMFDTESGTYEIWKVMRNFANVGFVIVFLMIIYSHLTSMGVSNYAIKKMLPRLIVASILVNVSFWICIIAVDISNVTGYALKDLLEDLSKRVVSDVDAVSSGGGGLWDTLAMSALGVGLVAGAAFNVFNAYALLPLLVLAAFTLLTVIAILTLRQAMIVILIILSPIAFVLYLLPNTESWFKKWMSAFRGLLLIFPIIAVIFGGAAVAGQAVMQAAGEYTGQSASDEINRFLMQAMGAAMMIAPLLLIGTIFNTILNIGGSTFGRISGMFNNPNKGPFDRIRKGAEAAKERGSNRMNRRAIKSDFNPRGAMMRYRGRRDFADNEQKREINSAMTGHVAAKVLDPNSGYLESIAGGDVAAKQRVKASATQTLDNQQEEQVKANVTLLKTEKDDVLLHIATDATADIPSRTAAQRILFQEQNHKAIDEIIKSTLTMTTEQKIAFGNEMLKTSNRPLYLGASGAGTLAKGENLKVRDETSSDPEAKRDITGIEDLRRVAHANNAYGGKGQMTGDSGDIERHFQFVKDEISTLNKEHTRRFIGEAKRLMSTPELRANLHKNLKVVDEISRLPPP